MSMATKNGLSYTLWSSGNKDMSLQVHSHHKCTILGEDVANGGGCACAGTRSKWGNSGPSSKFCCEPKTTLKKVSNVNKRTRLVQK